MIEYENVITLLRVLPGTEIKHLRKTFRCHDGFDLYTPQWSTQQHDSQQQIHCTSKLQRFFKHGSHVKSQKS